MSKQASYRVLQQAGGAFVIGRRTTELPGCAPRRDWVKVPVVVTAEGAVHEDFSRGIFNAGLHNLSNRRAVEDFLVEYNGAAILREVAL